MDKLIKRIVLFVLGRIKLIRCSLIKEEAYYLCKDFMLDATVAVDAEIGKYFYHTLDQYSKFYDKHGLQFSEVWDLLTDAQKKTLVYLAEEQHGIKK